MELSIVKENTQCFASQVAEMKLRRAEKVGALLGEENPMALGFQKSARCILKNIE